MVGQARPVPSPGGRFRVPTSHPEGGRPVLWSSCHRLGQCSGGPPLRLSSSLCENMHTQAPTSEKPPGRPTDRTRPPPPGVSTSGSAARSRQTPRGRRAVGGCLSGIGPRRPALSPLSISLTSGWRRHFPVFSHLGILVFQSTLHSSGFVFAVLLLRVYDAPVLTEFLRLHVHQDSPLRGRAPVTTQLFQVTGWPFN